jgi:hypothetical protein
MALSSLFLLKDIAISLPGTKLPGINELLVPSAGKKR